MPIRVINKLYDCAVVLSKGQILGVVPKTYLDNSKEVVKICTQYAQKGMYNIFIALFGFALALACLSSPNGADSAPVSFFVSYLLAIAVFGLFQAVFMANAGGSWDNAKKIVEVDMKEKGTPLEKQLRNWQKF